MRRPGPALQSLCFIAWVAGSMPWLCGCAHDRPTTRSTVVATQQDEGVSAPEDLMREHGVLRRVLLIYQECLRRIEAGQDLPPGAIEDSAQVISTFIEAYHERLEEDYLFPRFEKAGVLTGLAKTLREQHEAGRALTTEILRLAGTKTTTGLDDRANLAEDMRQFIRMYRPHAAREDTVLFPALRSVYPPGEYEDLGEAFEDKEHELLGDGGFERMVEKVAAIERTLGIYELPQFTPPKPTR